MFKEQMNKIKEFILSKKEHVTGEKKLDKLNKRKIENLVVFLVILIITLIIINSILSNNKKEVKEDESPYKVLANDSSLNPQATSEKDDLEKRLEKILETMVGVR